MIRAVKLVNAATHSIADLRRAQKTDLITVALRKCLEQGNLKGTLYECKEAFDDPQQLDPEIRKIVNDFTISGRQIRTKAWTKS